MHMLPTIKECNYTKILHVGNGRRAVEEMLNSVRPRQSHTNMHYRSLSK